MRFVVTGHNDRRTTKWKPGQWLQGLCFQGCQEHQWWSLSPSQSFWSCPQHLPQVYSHCPDLLQGIRGAGAPLFPSHSKAGVLAPPSSALITQRPSPQRGIFSHREGERSPWKTMNSHNYCLPSISFLPPCFPPFLFLSLFLPSFLSVPFLSSFFLIWSHSMPLPKVTCCWLTLYFKHNAPQITML